MKSLVVRILLTCLGAIFGFLGGSLVSIYLAARYAPATDDVPPFQGIFFGALFGLVIGTLVAQVPFAKRRTSSTGS